MNILNIKPTLDFIKAKAAAIWAWAKDSPSHFIVFAVALYGASFMWKVIFWYLVFPGSFALTFAAWRIYKKYISKTG